MLYVWVDNNLVCLQRHSVVCICCLQLNIPTKFYYVDILCSFVTCLGYLQMNRPLLYVLIVDNWICLLSRIVRCMHCLQKYKTNNLIHNSVPGSYVSRLFTSSIYFFFFHFF